MYMLFSRKSSPSAGTRFISFFFFSIPSSSSYFFLFASILSITSLTTKPERDVLCNGIGKVSLSHTHTVDLFDCSTRNLAHALDIILVGGLGSVVRHTSYMIYVYFFLFCVRICMYRSVFSNSSSLSCIHRGVLTLES